MRRTFCFALFALLAACSSPSHPTVEPNHEPTSEGGFPTSRQEPVSDVFHGVTVSEDYRWLENWEDPDVKAWTDAQNTAARAKLDTLPGVKTLRREVKAILESDIVVYYGLAYAGGVLFANKWAPPAQQPFVVTFADWNDPTTERIVLDPNTLDETGGTSVDWAFPSHDGKLLAASLSKGGSESGELHVFDVASGAEVHEVITGVNGGTAGGWLAWAADDSGFYYTRYPRPGTRPDEDMAFYVQLYYHALGTSPDDDRYELGNDFPRIAELDIAVDAPTGRVLCTVQNGDGGEFAHYVKEPGGEWRQFSTFQDKVVQATFGLQDDLYLLSNQDAPHGKLLHLNLDDLDVTHATELLPEGKDTIINSFWSSSSVVVTENRLYVLYQLGGPSEIRAFTHDGKPAPGPEQPPVTGPSNMTAVGGDNLLFRLSSYVEPTSVYHFDATTNATTATALVPTVPMRFENVEVLRELATSKDGTQIPVNIIRPAGAPLDGSMPLILTGYGGYGVSLTPGFGVLSPLLSKHGVSYAEVNLRGGGEFGEDWHRQGNLTSKQNVFDDFEAAAQLLIEKGYTSSARLAIEGGSNGGLLMGATFVQHPELARVVVSMVGIYDMLRVELSSNGAFNVTEFGTVKDPEQFKALLAYSPYHNVKDGVVYPPVLMTTGANDPRVEPMQSRKMTARLQAASPQGGPFLLLTNMDTGHGIGTPLDDTIQEAVDVLAFELFYLGVDVGD